MSQFSGGPLVSGSGNLVSLAALVALQDYRASLSSASHWASENITTAVTTILAPASNTTGMTVVAASFTGTNNDAALFADTAAPSAYTDTAKNAILRAGALNSNTVCLPYPIWVPSGRGLYVSSSGTVVGRVWYKLGA